MLPVLISTLVVLAIGAATVGLVVMGMEGRGRRRAPKLAGTMARAARHLNGERERGVEPVQGAYEAKVPETVAH